MMNEQKELAEFQFEGGSFLVEVDRPKGASVERAALPNTNEMVTQAQESFEAAIDRITPVAAKAIQRIRRGLTDPADEVEVKFGIKLSIETGAIITSVGGEANFEVVMKWKNK
jgi:hypothetical protein